MANNRKLFQQNALFIVFFIKLSSRRFILPITIECRPRAARTLPYAYSSIGSLWLEIGEEHRALNNLFIEVSFGQDPLDLQNDLINSAEDWCRIMSNI